MGGDSRNEYGVVLRSKMCIRDRMDAVQTEISEIARLASEERRELTDSEIQRLDELFQKMRD